MRTEGRWDLDENFMDFFPLVKLPLRHCGEREGFSELLQGLYTIEGAPDDLVRELQAPIRP